MSENELRQRKRAPRLASFEYFGSYAYFVTCATEHRNQHFKDKAIVDSLLPILRETSERFGFSIYAYCFMPDHLHLLVVGKDDSPLHGFMKLFKQQSSFVFRKVYGASLWQKSYYDHILRNEEALSDVALYIFNNPVRKGLVASYQDYPFLGSSVFDVKEPSQARDGQCRDRASARSERNVSRVSTDRRTGAHRPLGLSLR